MARIRTIKPEFWGDEKMAPLSAIDRLVFLGLISMADDAGRMVDNIKSIDGFIFPSTAESSRDSLDSLAQHSRIIRYTSTSGQRLIQVANWLRHQKVDRPSRYVLPAPAESSRDTRDSLAQHSRSDLGPTTNDRGPATHDLLPPTAAARERSALGVEGQPLADARDELVHLLGGEAVAGRTVDDFVAASPSANRFAWARGLIAMLAPLGGKITAPDVLLIAMQDFLFADREKWPFAGRVFRAFVDDAKRPKTERRQIGANPDNVFSKWAAETDAREQSAKAQNNA